MGDNDINVSHLMFGKGMLYDIAIIVILVYNRVVGAFLVCFDTLLRFLCVYLLVVAGRYTYPR